MNAFIKKEIRVLLPSFGCACVLALANLFVVDRSDSYFDAILGFASFVGCPALAIFIALNSFGVEVSSGTFSSLLSQPVSRRKIWETKIALLAVALVAVALLWLGSFFVTMSRFATNAGDNDWRDTLSAVTVFGLVIFSGGLWTVLLLRQAAAAFWFMLLVPGVLLTILAVFFIGSDGNFFEGMIDTVLGLYSLAGLGFARWLFLRAQDVQWSGGNIVMPEMRGRARLKVSASVRRWNPRAALWRKEFQLHQSQFVIAAALLAMHLGVRAVLKFCDLHESPDLEFVLQNIWGLWLVMPLLVGCAAVAEERKLGTLEGQLCLPVKRRTQFAIKLLVALGLSALFGVAVPWLIEGARILPDVHFSFFSPQVMPPLSDLSATQMFLLNGLLMLERLLPLLSLTAIALSIGLLSFYTSSLARNTLQTLAPAAFSILPAFFLLFALSTPEPFGLGNLWQGPLPYFVAVPLLLLGLLLLAFKNFQSVRTGFRLGLINLLLLALALVFSVAATTAVYHRFWEKFTPFEAAHGPARLTQANPARLQRWWDGPCVRRPDGIVWTAQYADPRKPLSQLFGNLTVALKDQSHFNGSNWVSIQGNWREAAGIKTDGTLWLSEAPMPWRLRGGSWNYDPQQTTNWFEFGVETNWASVLPMYHYLLLVKTDGTLWQLGTSGFDERHKKWPGFRSYQPHRVGTASDWAEAIILDTPWGHPSLQQSNGSIWLTASSGIRTNGLESLEIEPGFSMVKIYDGSQGRFHDTTVIGQNLLYQAGIREDGTFRIFGEFEWYPPRNGGGNEGFLSQNILLGTGTNWVALAGHGSKIVTLKSDGTLWLWDFSTHSHRRVSDEWWASEASKTSPTRLGSRSDWISIAGDDSSLMALAADGSLWFWPVENVDHYFGRSGNSDSFTPLLDVSRKPQRLGNIFDPTD